MQARVVHNYVLLHLLTEYLGLQGGLTVYLRATASKRMWLTGKVLILIFFKNIV